MLSTTIELGTRKAEPQGAAASRTGHPEVARTQRRPSRGHCEPFSKARPPGLRSHAAALANGQAAPPRAATEPPSTRQVHAWARTQGNPSGVHATTGRERARQRGSGSPGRRRQTSPTGGRGNKTRQLRAAELALGGRTPCTPPRRGGTRCTLPRGGTTSVSRSVKGARHKGPHAAQTACVARPSPASARRRRVGGWLPRARGEGDKERPLCTQAFRKALKTSG